MSIRTDTEERWWTKSQVEAESTRAAWKGNISGGKVSIALRLYIPSHPAIAVHCSQQPLSFLCFFSTEHQLLPSQLISCKLYELGDVLVIISYIVVYWEKAVGRVTRDFQTVSEEPCVQLSQRWSFEPNLHPISSLFSSWEKQKQNKTNTFDTLYIRCILFKGILL